MSRPRDASAAVVIQKHWRKPKDRHWTCDQCTLLNPPNATVCNACGCSKPIGFTLNQPNAVELATTWAPPAGVSVDGRQGPPGGVPQGYGLPPAVPAPTPGAVDVSYAVDPNADPNAYSPYGAAPQSPPVPPATPVAAANSAQYNPYGNAPVASANPQVPPDRRPTEDEKHAVVGVEVRQRPKMEPSDMKLQCPAVYENVDLASISNRDELERLFCVLQFLIGDKQIQTLLNLEYGNDDAFEVLFYQDMKSPHDAILGRDYQSDNYMGDAPDPGERGRSATQFVSFTAGLVPNDPEKDRWNKVWSLLVNDRLLDKHEQVHNFPRTIQLSKEETQKYNELIWRIKRHKDQKMFMCCHRALKALRMCEQSPAYQFETAFWHKIDSLCAVLLFRENYSIPKVVKKGDELWARAFAVQKEARLRKVHSMKEAQKQSEQSTNKTWGCVGGWTVKRLGRVVFSAVLAFIVIVGVSVETARGYKQFTEVVEENTRRGVQEVLDHLTFATHTIFDSSVALALAEASYDAGDFGNLNFNSTQDRLQLEMFLSSTLERNPTIQGLYLGKPSGDLLGYFRNSTTKWWEIAYSSNGCLQSFPSLNYTLNNITFQVPDETRGFPGCVSFVPSQRPWWKNGTQWTSPYQWSGQGETFWSVTASQSLDSPSGIVGVFAADYSLTDISRLLEDVSDELAPEIMFGYVVDSQNTVVASSTGQQEAGSSALTSSNPKLASYATLLKTTYGSPQQVVDYFAVNTPTMTWSDQDSHGLSAAKITVTFGNLTLYGVAVLDISNKANLRSTNTKFGSAGIVVGVLASVMLIISTYLFRLPEKETVLPVEQEMILGQCAFGLMCAAKCQKFESMDGTTEDLDQKDCGICGHRGADHIKRPAVPSDFLTPEKQRQNRNRFVLSVVFIAGLILAALCMCSVAINWYSSATTVADTSTATLVSSRVHLLSEKITAHLSQAEGFLQSASLRVQRNVLNLPLFPPYDIGSRAAREEETRNVSYYQPVFNRFDPYLVENLLSLDNSIFYFIYFAFPDDTFLGATKDGETGQTLIGSQDPFNTCFSKYLWNDILKQRDTTYRIWQQPACNYYPTKQRWWKDAERNNGVVFGFPSVTPTGKLLVTASLAVRDSLGDPIVIVGVDLDLGGFNNLLKTSKLGNDDTARSFVIQHRQGMEFGLMIASSDTPVTTETTDGNWIAVNSTDSDDPFTQAAAQYVTKVSFDHQQAEIEPVQFPRALTDPLTAVYVLGSQDWLFVMLGDWEEFYGPLNREASFMFVLVAGLVLTLLIASGLGYAYIQAFAVEHEIKNKQLDALGKMDGGIGMTEEEYAELIKFSREIQVVKQAAVRMWEHECESKRKFGNMTGDAPLVFEELTDFFDKRATEIFRNAKIHRNILSLATMELRDPGWFCNYRVASRLYLFYSHYYYRKFVGICTSLLLLMICFEPPSLEALQANFDPRVSVPTLFLYLILVFDTTLRMILREGLKARNAMDPPGTFAVDIALCVVLSISFLDFIAKIGFRVSFEYYFPLRPLIAVFQSESIFQAAVSFVAGCWKSRNALLLFLATVLTTACIGHQLFRDVPALYSLQPAKDSFATFFSAILSTFIYIGSGENYTNLVYPVLHQAALQGVKIAFLVVSSMLGIFVIVSFILAEFQTAVTISRRNQLKFELLEERASYIAAFLLLDLNRTGIPLHSFATFLVGLQADVNEKEVIKIFHKLDRDSDGQINLEEFLAAVELYLDLDPMTSFEERDPTPGRLDDCRKFLRDNLIFNKRNRRSFLDQVGLCLLVVQLWVYAGFASIDKTDQTGNAEFWLDFANISCVVLFAWEVGVKIFALGWHGYWFFSYYEEYQNLERRQFAMRIDLILLFLTVLVSIPTALALSGNADDLTLVRLPLSITLLRVFSMSSRVNGIVFVVYKLLEHLWAVAMLFLVFFYIWAVIGILLLRQRIKATLLDNAPAAQFDDFPNTLLALFQLLVGESWQEVMYASIAASNYYICVYFISWSFLVSMLLTNVFIGLLLSSAQILSGRERLSTRDIQKCFLMQD